MAKQISFFIWQPFFRLIMSSHINFICWTLTLCWCSLVKPSRVWMLLWMTKSSKRIYVKDLCRLDNDESFPSQVLLFGFFSFYFLNEVISVCSIRSFPFQGSCQQLKCEATTFPTALHHAAILTLTPFAVKINARWKKHWSWMHVSSRHIVTCKQSIWWEKSICSAMHQFFLF